MPPTLTLTDRLRIERTVLLLDTHLSDLPRRSRLAKRREVRANLRDAAADVGTAEALRRLGEPRRLAAGYLAAEYGDVAPRPSWTAALLCAAVTMGVAQALVEAATASYRSGLLAADPHLQGTVHWHGLSYLSGQVTFAFSDGKSTTTGGAWTPWVYVAVLAAGVLGGRLWRLLPVWRGKRTGISAGAQ
ncbi:hypothetical protein [Streptomyces mirabilis]|uniref:Uncharacterized protein n=1 Tax=Streptomyces mirabilis TaxID=68239 RepID=A0ABU3V6P2_9ACTN|nr:hypothetical protein [Streptomyces mirabilis]MDU9001823.1 hypothetical protein [Streptomyces mirabilis]